MPRHDWRLTLYEVRRATNLRLKEFLLRVAAGEWSPTLYADTYDRVAVRGARLHLEEDFAPGSLRLDLCRALVVSFDLTVGRRYRVLLPGAWRTEFTAMLERVPPQAMRQWLQAGGVPIHGGNGGWPGRGMLRMLWDSRVEDAAIVELFRILLRRDSRPPEAASAAEIIDRLQTARRHVERSSLFGFGPYFCTWLIHACAPAAWPVMRQGEFAALTAGTGIELPIVQHVTDYEVWASEARRLAAAKGLPDLTLLDIALGSGGWPRPGESAEG